MVQQTSRPRISACLFQTYGSLVLYSLIACYVEALYESSNAWLAS